MAVKKVYSRGVPSTVKTAPSKAGKQLTKVYNQQQAAAASSKSSSLKPSTPTPTSPPTSPPTQQQSVASAAQYYNTGVYEPYGAAGMSIGAANLTRTMESESRMAKSSALKQDNKGWSNVLATFRQIGSNIVQGKWLSSVPVAEKYKGTFLGGAASLISKPLTIFGAPAAVAAVKVAAPAIAAKTAALKSVVAAKVSAAAASTKTAIGVTAGALGTSSALKAVGVGLAGLGGLAAINQFSSEGLLGIWRGADPTITTEEMDEDGNLRRVITMKDPAGSEGGVVYVMGADGQPYPVYVGAGTGAPQIISDKDGETIISGGSAAPAGAMQVFQQAKPFVWGAMILAGLYLFKRK